MSKWIKSCTPPDSYRKVLAYSSPDYVCTAMYLGKDGWVTCESYDSDGVFDGLHVDYWMPIPKTPRGSRGK